MMPQLAASRQSSVARKEETAKGREGTQRRTKGPSTRAHVLAQDDKCVVAQDDNCFWSMVAGGTPALRSDGEFAAGAGSRLVVLGIDDHVAMAALTAGFGAEVGGIAQGKMD